MPQTVATTPTVYGIETREWHETRARISTVATTPTVYGIETTYRPSPCFPLLLLQQHLPFTVLKLCNLPRRGEIFYEGLQQHLPFTVLKRPSSDYLQGGLSVATTPTVYGIETHTVSPAPLKYLESLQQHLPFTVLKPYVRKGKLKPFQAKVATTPTVYGIETN